MHGGRVDREAKVCVFVLVADARAHARSIFARRSGLRMDLETDEQVSIARIEMSGGHRRISIAFKNAQGYCPCVHPTAIIIVIFNVHTYSTNAIR